MKINNISPLQNKTYETQYTFRQAKKPKETVSKTPRPSPPLFLVWGEGRSLPVKDCLANQ